MSIKDNNKNIINWKFDPVDKTVVHIDIQKYDIMLPAGDGPAMDLCIKNIQELLGSLHKILQELVYVGVKTIRHNVLKQDWETTLLNSKTTWKIYKKLNNIPYKNRNHFDFMEIYILECPMDDFLQNVKKGLGI